MNAEEERVMAMAAWAVANQVLVGDGWTWKDGAGCWYRLEWRAFIIGSAPTITFGRIDGNATLIRTDPMDIDAVKRVSDKTRTR